MLALMLVAASGCEGETGIIIDISLDISSGGLPEPPDTLEIIIGLAEDEPVISWVCRDSGGGRFIQTDGTEERRVTVDGRDLAADPYRLLLHPSAELAADRDMMIVVVAESKGAQVGHGELAGPVRFTAGIMQRWPIVLGTLGSAHVQDGCVCTSPGDGDGVVMGAVVNRDCDGFSTPDDCDDRNANVYPGAPEICDGVDNNCNQQDQRFPEQAGCFDRDEEGCFHGEYTCDDMAGDGERSECSQTVSTGDRSSSRAPETMCEAFSECEPTADQAQCAIETAVSAATTIQCNVLLNEGGEVCSHGGVFIPADDTTDQLGCRWYIFGGASLKGSYDVGFWTADAEDTDDSQLCQPIFRVTGARDASTTDRVFLWRTIDSTLDQTLRIELQPRQMPVCPPPMPGLECDGLRSAEQL